MKEFRKPTPRKGDKKLKNQFICNDQIWVDTDGNEILAQGGDVTKVENTYYWFGAEFQEEPKFTSIKCYSSDDLINWKFERNVLTRQLEGNLSETGWVGRPSVLYNDKTKKYVMIFEWNNFGMKRNRVAFAESETINGEYVFKEASILEGRSLGDMGVFQDDDGCAYLLTVMDEGLDLEVDKEINYDLAICKLNPDYIGIESKIFEGFEMCKREAPYIVKRNGVYYWFHSDMRGWESSETKYSVATALEGPWSEQKLVATEPETLDSYNSQHDFIITVKGLNKTSYVYCGDRYSNFHGQGIGRYVWIPLEFVDDRPVLKFYSSWSIDVTTGEWSAN